jgi:hypothetical protein
VRAPSLFEAARLRTARLLQMCLARLGGEKPRQAELNGRRMLEEREYRRFRVESAEPYGWVVYLEGTRRTHFFMARGLALSLAKVWAQAIPPSKVQLVDLSGRVTQEWTFTRLLKNA